MNKETQEKLVFLSQYIYQDVYLTGKFDKTTEILMPSKIADPSALPDCCLVLKPLMVMSEEDAFHILRMAYGCEEAFGIKLRNFQYRYQPYDPSMFSDAYEAIHVYAEGITFGNTWDLIRLTIFKEGSLSLSYVRSGIPEGLPIRNQSDIFDYIRERGYSLKFRGKTIEDQKMLGWIK